MDGRPGSAAAAAAAIISYRSTRETDDFRNSLNPWTRDAPLSLEQNHFSMEKVNQLEQQH